MYVRPLIAQEQAQVLLAKPPRPLARKRKIVKAELFYLPCYLFNAKVDKRDGSSNSGQICVDAIKGSFAFFLGVEFDGLPIEPYRTSGFLLSVDSARQLGLDGYRRHLLLQSLKRREQASLHSFQFDKEIYYPYWIGYFRRKSRLDFEVVDALSGQRQGVKMREVFIAALLQAKKGAP